LEVEAVETDELYKAYKPLLFSLAYHMLGSVMDAEDIVHDAFLALNSVQKEDIRNLKSYLCKIVSNRCIDTLRSARAKREVYVGPWLPEPLVADPAPNDPMQLVINKDTVSTAFLLLMEKMTPTERAVFVLREALNYDYEEIAEIVGKTSANCRQIFRRSKQRLSQSGLTTAEAENAEQKNALIERFVNALGTGDTEQLLEMLSADIVLYSDGGGKVTAAVHPIAGQDRVLRFLLGLLAKVPADFSFRFAPVNGGPGILAFAEGKLLNVVSFSVREGQIRNVYITVNPDKLQHLQNKIWLRSHHEDERSQDTALLYYTKSEESS
jgi:RNA polymerase sigma-70 factor (ECF subfamily)